MNSTTPALRHLFKPCRVEVDSPYPPVLPLEASLVNVVQEDSVAPAAVFPHQ